MQNIEVSNQVKQQLVERQLMSWRNTMEDYRISAIVAEAISDEGMKERVKSEMTKCVKAIEALEKMLSELQNGDAPKIE